MPVRVLSVASPRTRLVRALVTILALGLTSHGLHAQQAGVPESPDDQSSTNADPDHFGSANVPMDSWVYPALERLADMGYIPSQDVSIRPWSRLECQRQMKQAQDLVEDQTLEQNGDGVSSGEAQRILSELSREFSEEPGMGAVVLESAYARFGTIAGPALTDSYHIGQTWWNDFGRPLARGTSALAGISLRANRGRFFFYDRQELQQDPGVPTLTPQQTQLIFKLDAFPSGPAANPAFIPAVPLAAYTRQRPLELYAGVAFGGNALSFGKQEIYWGPTVMGPLAFSSNAEPTYNLRFMSTRPHPFPFVPQLGTYRFDVVFGKLSGHKYPARPYFNGSKIELTFTPNFEVSFTRWSVLWGVGHPMTLHSLKANLFSTSSTGTSLYGDRTDPGDRKSDFDFRLHVPGLSKVITLYADAYADDELNPIDAPRRVVWSPGIYIARLPHVPHADLRLEMASSEELAQDECCLRFFWNNQYYDDNLNKGFLLGNAVGRNGRAVEGKAGYWFTPRSRLEFGYRQNKISENFMAHGGTISDGFVNGTWNITPEWTAHIFAQYERFFIPAYLAGSRHNQSGWFDVTWAPKLHIFQQAAP